MDELAKSGVRTRKRNKSIKDSAKLVSHRIYLKKLWNRGIFEIYFSNFQCISWNWWTSLVVYDSFTRFWIVKKSKIRQFLIACVKSHRSDFENFVKSWFINFFFLIFKNLVKLLYLRSKLWKFHKILNSRNYKYKAISNITCQFFSNQSSFTVKTSKVWKIIFLKRRFSKNLSKYLRFVSSPWQFHKILNR